VSLRSSLIAVSFAILLLAPGPALAVTATVAAGESAVYSYTILTTNKGPGGVNVTTSMPNQETVTVDNVSSAGNTEVVGYTLTVTEANGTTLNPPLVGTNYTSIFDPYNNLTYFAQPWIGFYPFTYPDLAPGFESIRLNITVTNVPGGSGTGTASVIDLVNATVTRSPGSIDVNFTAVPQHYSGQAGRGLFVMKFDPVTGWLDSMTLTANALGVEKIFTYRLLSYTLSKPAPNYSSYVWYVVIVAVAALVAYEVVTRKSRRERKKSRMREKFTGRP